MIFIKQLIKSRNPRNLFFLLQFLVLIGCLVFYWRRTSREVRNATLAAVIPLSSLETAWIEDTIREALRIASPVVVAYADHLSDGIREDLTYIDKLRQTFSNSPKLIFVPVQWHSGLSSRFWVRYLRYAAVPFVPLETDYIIWLDADEVVDSENFNEWWISNKGLPARKDGATKLANYVYFRNSRFQRIELDDSVVISRRLGMLADSFFENPWQEREAFFYAHPGAKHLELGLGGRVLVHHMSWVRSKEGMLQKVSAWGHAGERDWKALVENEWSRDFNGHDFISASNSYRILDRPWIEELRERRMINSTVQRY
jgi:hypothetical protein